MSRITLGPGAKGTPDATADLPIPADAWDEANAGSFRRLWLGSASHAPVLGGGLALLCAVSVGLGWATGSEPLQGAYFELPPITGWTAILIGLLGAAIVLSRSGANGRARHRRAAKLVVLAAIAGATVLLVNEVSDRLLFDWAADGAWQQPISGPVVMILLLSVGVLMIDAGGPRYRWNDFLNPLIAGALMVGLLAFGYQVDLGIGRMDPAFSLTIMLVTVAAYLGYFFLRPDRGIAGFMLATGPGPAMARFLVPTVMLLPVLISTSSLCEPLVGDRLAEGLGDIVMLGLLLLVVTGTSRRLQRFYRAWQIAEAGRAERAAVLSSMSDGVAMLRDEDQEIILTNPQFDLMYGYGPGELIGRHVSCLYPADLDPEEKAEWVRLERELKRTGQVAFEGRSVGRDGATIWARSKVSVADHPEHGPVRIIVVGDITAEHRAKEAGARALDRFRQVFEQSPIGICLVRPDGTFERVNSAYERITGYTAGELEGIPFTEITHADDLEEDRRLVRSLFKGEIDRYSLEKRNIRKDGDVVWVDLTVARLSEVAGDDPRALYMVEDITERHQFHQRLQHMVDHDALSGLFGRRRFREELASALAGPADSQVALLSLDLDNLKFVNDSFGHTVGDQLIVRAAEVLRAHVNGAGILARPGGDEFAVLLPGLDGEAARLLAEGLAEAISAEVRVGVADRTVRLTVSIGIATAQTGEDASTEQILMEADTAMYDAKASGRNCVRLYDRTGDPGMAKSIDWHSRIGRALESGGFRLYAQPIVSLEGSGPAFFELLIRMRDDDESIVQPGTFLPIAERHDLIQDIDQWVISSAIKSLAGFDLGGDDLKFSVNLSGRSVGDPRLPDFIATELDRYRVDPGSLVFEITETGAISDMTGARKLAEELGQLGCSMALDDFGTGFASFYNLKHIDCDYLKIDGEFVHDLATERDNRLLVRSLVYAARAMGKLTVAEGVEDGDSLELLRQFGVDFAQGYYLGTPKPLAMIVLDPRLGVGPAEV
ncbi:MAG: EAL domain-containing protein [Solirubrobacterales bacterium]|nr:EAL domain-containing protein [Solirubrobacterales bacterium]